jgi:hypothetical protein
VVGNPAHIISEAGKTRVDEALEMAKLPDPLTKKLSDLEARLSKLENNNENI